MARCESSPFASFRASCAYLAPISQLPAFTWAYPMSANVLASLRHARAFSAYRMDSSYLWSSQYKAVSRDQPSGPFGRISVSLLAIWIACACRAECRRTVPTTYSAPGLSGSSNSTLLQISMAASGSPPSASFPARSTSSRYWLTVLDLLNNDADAHLPKSLPLSECFLSVVLKRG